MLLLHDKTTVRVRCERADSWRWAGTRRNQACDDAGSLKVFSSAFIISAAAGARGAAATCRAGSRGHGAHQLNLTKCEWLIILGFIFSERWKMLTLERTKSLSGKSVTLSLYRYTAAQKMKIQPPSFWKVLPTQAPRVDYSSAPLTQMLQWLTTLGKN